MTKVLQHLWFARDMATAVRFDTATIPGSTMGAVHTLPAETPSGPAEAMLTMVKFDIAALERAAEGAAR